MGFAQKLPWCSICRWSYHNFPAIFPWKTTAMFAVAVLSCHRCSDLLRSMSLVAASGSASGSAMADGWMDGWIDVCMHIYIYMCVCVYVYIYIYILHIDGSICFCRYIHPSIDSIVSCRRIHPCLWLVGTSDLKPTWQHALFCGHETALRSPRVVELHDMMIPGFVHQWMVVHICWNTLILFYQLPLIVKVSCEVSNDPMLGNSESFHPHMENHPKDRINIWFYTRIDHIALHQGPWGCESKHQKGGST